MAAPTVTPTASDEKFAMPPYPVVLALTLSWVAGTAWMLQWGMPVPAALVGGLLVTMAATLLLAPMLAFLVIPALTAVVTVAQAPLVVAGVLLRAFATGFMSGLRSAAARRPMDPPHQ